MSLMTLIPRPIRESTRADWLLPPNIITMTRLVFAAVPAVLLLLAPDDPVFRWAAVATFMLVAATDFVDGLVARRFNMVSNLGKTIDPAVDKVLVAMTLIGLCIVGNWQVWGLTAAIVMREVVVTLRIRAAHPDQVFAAAWSGKIKMATQVVMILILLAPSVVSWWLLATSIAMVLTVLVTAWSWYDYERRFVKAKK